jgi:beta-N-acetylhexosaminidase
MDSPTRPLSSMTIREKIGQMLLIGFPAGEAGVDILRRAVAEFSAGNIILFSRNVGSTSELFALNKEIRSIVQGGVGILPFIAIDQEGGIVARISEGVTPIPGAMAQASAVAGGLRSATDVRALGAICGKELLALGINWNLAPVADVNVNPANPVIGVRSYGEDPAKVAELAAAFAAGLADAGVMATAKHFPGHGDTTVDSHLGLPLIPHDASRLESVEMLPFKRLIAEGIASIMTAHVRFPAFEPDALPATLSSKVIRGLLREKLGFKGLVTTDCLEMKAIADNYPDAAVMAVKAGADLLDISHTYELQATAAKAIEAAVLRGEISEARLDESVARIAAAKAALARPLSSWEEAASRLSRPESLALSDGVYRDSLCLIRQGSGLPPAPSSLYVDIVPQLSSLVENPSLPSGLVAAALDSFCPGRFRSVSIPVDPDGSSISRVLAAAEGRNVVVGLHNASSNPGQVRLLTALSECLMPAGRTVGIVSMRSPYDARLAPESLSGSAFLCAFEYTRASARAVARYLSGAYSASGSCPVSV